MVLLPGVSQKGGEGLSSELHFVQWLIPGAVFQSCSLTANLVPFSSFNYSNSSHTLPAHPLWYTGMLNVICSGRTRWSLFAGSSDFSLRTWQMLSAEWSLWVILAPFCFLFSYFCMSIPYIQFLISQIASIVGLFGETQDLLLSAVSEESCVLFLWGCRTNGVHAAPSAGHFKWVFVVQNSLASLALS